MGVAHSRVTVGTTATQLSSNYSGNDGQTLNVQNPAGGVDVFLGGAGVTSTNYGYLLKAETSLSIDLLEHENLYAVVASGTQVVNVILQGV